MSFWNTFVKVWQVRASVRIQESIENSFFEAQRRAEIQSNIDEIFNEVSSKNNDWRQKLDFHRTKSKK